MKRFLSHLLVATTTTLGVNLWQSQPTQAATFTYDFTVEITNPEAADLLPTSTFNGFFSYDDTVFLDADGDFGDSVLYPFTNFSFSFINFSGDGSIVPFTYTLEHLLDLPDDDFIADSFGGIFNGVPVGTPPSLSIENQALAFILNPLSSLSIDFLWVGILGNFSELGSLNSFSILANLDSEDPEFETIGEFTSVRLRTNTPPASVPEPGTLAGLSLLGLGLATRKFVPDKLTPSIKTRV